MSQTERYSMAKSRALLTETEREQIAGDHGDERKYQATSRARARINDELTTDVEILKEHNPELYEELRDAVVDSNDDVRGRESGETPSPPEADQHTETEPEADTASPEATDTDVLAAVEYPAGRTPEKCDAAVRAARSLIIESGGATKQEIVAEVMPEHPAGYDADAALSKIDDGDRYRGAWWRKVVKPGLGAFDDVAKPPRGASEWSHTDEK